ncbi:MAG: glycosyltransferase family 4 protein [Actinomycetota bacterium]|nr:glycosyltransferase family 4 protein [Actinomycetota bacterium]
MSHEPRRALFVFRKLVVGGEETEVRLLAKNLDPRRYRIEVVACVRKPGMPEQTHRQIEELGVPLDRTPYGLSPEEEVVYLAEKVRKYHLVVACQSVPFVYPALERLAPEARPPLIEHGGLVSEVFETPKHLTTRYVGVCRTIRNAAACLMPHRTHHAIEIPSMVDLSEFDPADRPGVRREWGAPEGTPVIGWVGRLERKKRVEDFIRAAAIVRDAHPQARFVVIGGPAVSMPEYADELRALARELALGDALRFLGDRPDVPRLLSGLDIFVWLSRGEGMPHVVSEAGAAGLPVVATRDNGSEEQIVDDVSGLFVPHESPRAVASELGRLIRDPRLRRRLGRNLRLKVEREYGAAAVARRWEELFDRVVAETERSRVRVRRQ